MEDTKKKNKEKFWMGLALFLLGIVVGFIFAPVKKGVMIGSNNWARECGNGSTVDLPACDEITSEDADDEDSQD